MFVFPWDSTFRVAIGVIVAALALVVLRAGPRRGPNQVLALFLGLVAGNLLLDFLSKGFRAGGDAATERLLMRLAFQMFLLDPPLLLYFTLIYPVREPREGGWVVLLFVPAALLTILHLAAPQLLFPVPYGILAPDVQRASFLLRGIAEAHLAAFYLGAFFWQLRRLAREENRALLDQQVLLVQAVGVAILPRIGLTAVFWPVGSAFLGLRDLALAITFDTALSVASVAIVFFAGLGYARRKAGPPQQRAVRRAFLVMGAFLLLVVALFVAALAEKLLRLPDVLVPTASFPFGELQYPFRWLFFAAVVAYALLRYQALGVELKVRRLAEVGGGAAAFGAVLAASVLAALAAAEAISAWMVLALALAAALGPRAAGWGLRQARARMAPANEDDLVGRRLDFYRASLERAVVGHQVAPSAEDELRRLRADLGISEEQHGVLLAMARMRRPGGLRESDEGRLAGRYEVGEVLGQGSSGRCFLARDVLLGRTVVVKEVPRVGEHTPALLREARAAGQLNHPNIVTIHDAFETPGRSFLVMEHAEGGNLRERQRAGPLPRAEATRILSDVLSGLAAAHGKGIVHGDLKPENVLLAGEGRAKIADFGSAYSPARATMAGLPSRPGPGTLLYMAPEQVRGDPPTAASDLYAVGAMAWELYAGSHYLPLAGKNDFQVREAILHRAPVLGKARLPAALQSWLRRGLAKEPDHRFPSAQAALAALQQAAGT